MSETDKGGTSVLNRTRIRENLANSLVPVTPQMASQSSSHPLKYLVYLNDELKKDHLWDLGQTQQPFQKIDLITWQCSDSLGLYNLLWAASQLGQELHEGQRTHGAMFFIA